MSKMNTLLLLILIASVACLKFPSTFSSDVAGKLTMDGRTVELKGRMSTDGEVFRSDYTVLSGRLNYTYSQAAYRKNSTSYGWDESECASRHSVYEEINSVLWANNNAVPRFAACSGPGLRVGRIFEVVFPEDQDSPFLNKSTICASLDEKAPYWISIGNSSNRLSFTNFKSKPSDLSTFALPNSCAMTEKTLAFPSTYAYEYVSKSVNEGNVTVTEGSVHKTDLPTVFLERSEGENDTITTFFPGNGTAYYDYQSFCFRDVAETLYSDLLSRLNILPNFRYVTTCSWNDKQGALWSLGEDEFCTSEDGTVPYFYSSVFGGNNARIEYSNFRQVGDFQPQLSLECRLA